MPYDSLAVATVRSLPIETPCYGDDGGEVKTAPIKENLCFLGSSFSFVGERLPVCQHGEVVGETQTHCGGAFASDLVEKREDWDGSS